MTKLIFFIKQNLKSIKLKVFRCNFIKLPSLSLCILLFNIAVPVSMVNAATITVDSLADDFTDNGSCTLREALESADNDTQNDACVMGDGDDTIEFDPSLTSTGPATITLLANLPTINSLNGSIIINGPGAELLTIDGNANQYNLFSMNGALAFTQHQISGLTLANGTQALLVSSNAGTIKVTVKDIIFDSNITTGGGSAIRLTTNTDNPNQIDFTVKRSTFTNNQSILSTSPGLNINGPHKVLIEDSTFVNNQAKSGASVISTSGNSLPGVDIKIRRSTFSHNKSEGGQPAISLSVSGSVASIEVANTTIYANDCNSDEDGFSVVGGLRIFGSEANAVLSNNIIAGNICGSELGRNISIDSLIASLTTNGGNFIGTTNPLTFTASLFPVGSPNANNDFVGENTALLDPELLALADNGGPTQTHLPDLNGATGGVIDKGVCPSEKLDQRGLGNNETKNRAVNLPEIADGVNAQGCDSGAVELNAEMVEIIPDETFCVPIKTTNNALAVICL